MRSLVKNKLWCETVIISSDNVVLFLFSKFFRSGEWKNGSEGTVGLLAMDHVLTVRLEYKHTSIDDTYVFSF